MHTLARFFATFQIPQTTASIQKLTLFLTVWFALAYNIPFITEMWVSLGQKSFTLIVLYTVMIFCLLLLNLLVLNILSIKGIFKPSVICLFLISTILLYSNFTGKQYNPFAFDFNEWVAGTGRFLSVKFLLALLFLFIIPSAILIRTTINWGATKKRLVIITVSIALTSLTLTGIYRLIENSVQPIYEVTRGSLNNVIPIHFIDSSAKFIRYQYFNPIKSFSILDKAPIISSKADHKTLVLVIGESIRADIFSKYISSIETINPAQNSAITSCDTYSDSSLECIFSFLSADQFSESNAKHQQNVLDLLSLSGVNIIWLSNQNGCGILCAKANVLEVNLTCTTQHCDDLELADTMLAQALNTINPRQPNLIIIHTKNISSPLYSKFYPKAYSKYLPECNTIFVGSCTDNELINSYNNAMYYVSVILGRVVKQLEQFGEQHKNVDIALVFTSKHGESLGENGHYFHGSPRVIAPIEQLLVPLLIIDANLPQNCLSSIKKSLSHDVIAHTLLGQFHVKTKVYETEHDIQAVCTNLINKTFVMDSPQSFNGATR